MGTDFSKAVRHRLIDLDKRQKWLREEVELRTGLKLDNPYFQMIMRGDRHPPKIINAICEILDIEET